MRIKKGYAEAYNYKKYHIPARPAYCKRPKNALYLSTANTLSHELGKSIVCYFISKYGDCPHFPAEIKDALKTISKWEKEQEKVTVKQKHVFITEAVPNDNKDIRADVVRLVDAHHFEIESSKTRAKRFIEIDNVTVIGLW